MDDGARDKMGEESNAGHSMAAESNAAAIVAFYRQYKEAPTTRVHTPMREALGQPEHLLARSLYKLRAATKAGKDTESIRLLRREAPKLLKPVQTMEEKAALCVAHLRPNPPASDSETKKWRKFIENCKSAMKHPSKRERNEPVYRILSKGLPDYFDDNSKHDDGTQKMKKRGTSTATLRAPSSHHGLLALTA